MRIGIFPVPPVRPLSKLPKKNTYKELENPPIKKKPTTKRLDVRA